MSPTSLWPMNTSGPRRRHAALGAVRGTSARCFCRPSAPQARSTARPGARPRIGTGFARQLHGPLRRRIPSVWRVLDRLPASLAIGRCSPRRLRFGWAVLLSRPPPDSCHRRDQIGGLGHVSGRARAGSASSVRETSVTQGLLDCCAGTCVCRSGPCWPRVFAPDGSLSGARCTSWLIHFWPSDRITQRWPRCRA